MKRFYFITVLFLVVNSLALSLAQSKYKSDTGFASFYSSAPIEDIYAENKTVKSLIDLKTNAIAFVVTISDYTFKKSLMQKHFNEKYMESDKFPKATFSGYITSISDLKTVGNHIVKVKGDMTIHGVKKTIEVEGTIQNMDEELKATSEFNIKLADYDIKIPKLLVKNIAEEVLVRIKIDYSLMK